MIDFFVRLDTALMLWLNGFHNSFWDTFMFIVTDKWTWVPMYCVILYVLYWKYGFKVILMWLIVMFFVAIAFSDQVCGGYLRLLVARARPSQPDSPIYHFIHVVENYRGGHYGFPSCHAGNSFALAMLLYLFFRNKQLTIFIFCWAAINSYSRIYCGLHYPGDILIGGLLGAAGSFCIYFAFRYALKLKHNETYKQINMISYVGIATFVLIFIWSGIRLFI
jgi:undecaprenyl-diphosphatase